MNKQYIGDLFLTTRWYLLMAGSGLVFLISWFVPWLFEPAIVLFSGLLLLSLLDYALLFFTRGRLSASRQCPPRLSLGDDNAISIQLKHDFPFTIHATFIDELPLQFQERSFSLQFILQPHQPQTQTYQLKPLSRGVYTFGRLLAYARSPLQLLQRRISCASETSVRVYPAFARLKQYQLMAMSDSQHYGAKKLRRTGHSMEFEKIKDYVQGDDVRTINWKATARNQSLMVNTYTDARQQQIYCLIDKGRSMKMAFEGMSLLDYAINASLALLHVALLRQDRAGLVTFAEQQIEMVAAERRNGQMNQLLETLYHQQTHFKESDYETLWARLHPALNQRSFLLLFTNFETMNALERQLPYLRQMARRHLLCVVFFENTLLRDLQQNQPDTTEGIYIRTIAGQFAFEKKQIVRELRRHGILSILSTPRNLSVDVINKYLELKARQMI